MELSEKEKLMTLIALRMLDSFILQELSKCEAENICMPCFFKGLKSVIINERDTRELVKKFLNEIEG